MSTSVAAKTAQRREEGTRVVELPQGVTASLEGRRILVKGPNGSASKVYEKIPVDITVQGNKVTVKPFTGKKKDVISANTVSSIVRGLVHGVTKGYEYRLKVIFAHFPVTVKVKDGTIMVENFMGERSPRLAKILPDCKVTTDGDDIIIKGTSIEHIGQTAANVEQATKVKRKDQRIFLDGVYVYEKKRN